MITTSKKFRKITKEFVSLKRTIRESGLKADMSNSRFKESQYASIQQVRNTLEPIIDKQNWYLTVDMVTETQGDVLAVKIIACLTFLGKGVFKKGEGEWIQMETSYPVSRYANSGSYPNPQKIEATRTYGTRCTILALVGISAEKDDDGNQTSNTDASQQITGMIDFDNMLNSAKNLKDIETVLSAAQEAFDLGSLSSMALKMVTSKAEGLMNERRVQKELKERKLSRQLRIIEKLNNSMIHASSFSELETVWRNFHLVEGDLNDYDCKQIKHSLHQEAMRISNGIMSGEILVVPVQKENESSPKETEQSTGAVLELVENIPVCSQTDTTTEQLPSSEEEMVLQPDLVSEHS